MARFSLVAILILSLGGCAADDVGGGAVDAAILMSVGEWPVGQARDEGNQIPKEMSVAADTPHWAADHTLWARIYDLREDPGGIRHEFQDLSDFDVISVSRTDPSLMELLRFTPEEQTAPPKSPVVTEVSPRPEPPVSEGITGSSYQIQLGALPSRESARREWMRIERRHPDLVQNQVLNIVPVELDSQMGTVFRLRTGPISEITSARSICGKFRSNGQDCFVVKYENPS
jgi:hypothetical protein